MTNEKLSEILETKRLLDNANWLLGKLKEIEPVECFTFYGEENTSCYEKTVVKDAVEFVKIAKEELERRFSDL